MMVLGMLELEPTCASQHRHEMRNLQTATCSCTSNLYLLPYLCHLPGTLSPRLVRRGIGAVRVTVGTLATVAFCLYLVIIVQTLTN